MPHSQPIGVDLAAGNLPKPRRAGLFFLVLLLLTLAGAGSWWWWWSSQRQQEDTFTLVTWNLQWFPGKHPKATPEESAAHLKAVQTALKAINPDILCLQEVRSEADAIELAANDPDLKAQVVSDFEKPFGNSQQLAILSRSPGVTTWAEPFTAHGPVDPPRGFACAALDAGDGLLILVYTLHLKSNLGDLEKNIAKREESIQQLITHVREVEPTLRNSGSKQILLVVAGDLNTDPTDTDRFGKERTFDLLGELGLETDLLKVPLDQRVTLPAEGKYPDACFDWILVRPLEGVQVRTEVLVPPGGDEVSDHRPVLVEILR